MVWDLRSLCDKADYAIIRYAINRIRLYLLGMMLALEAKLERLYCLKNLMKSLHTLK